jgi:hypothetical protein
MHLLVRSAAIAAVLAPAALCHARLSAVAPAPFDFAHPNLIAKGRGLVKRILDHIDGGDLRGTPPIDGTRGAPPSLFGVWTVRLKRSF